MGKKIFKIILLLGTLLYAEIGRITLLEGEVLVSRNNESYRPWLSSRIYPADWLICSENSKVEFRTPSQIVSILGPAKVQIISTENYFSEYGEIKVREIPPKINKRKSLTNALLYTAIYPGTGHFYIEDYPKAIPMFVASGYLLYNIITLDPKTNVSERYKIITQKEHFRQIYFVYWALALLDVTAETNLYNKKIDIEESSIQVSWSINL